MAIDPRISARRVAVRRAEGRRRLRFLVVALGLVATAVGAWGLTRTALLDLDHVRYEGVTGADIRFVEQTAGLSTGTAMFDLDLGGVERDLTAIPWVESATATREWPGTVRVEIEPRLAVAVIGSGDRPAFVIDDEGVLIRTADDETALPRIDIVAGVGLGEVEERARPAIEVVLALPDDLQHWVEAVTLDADEPSERATTLGLDLVGSARVHLGATEFVGDKLAAVRAVLEGTDLTCLAVIDVAVADLPTITRDPSCEAGPSQPGGGSDA